MIQGCVGLFLFFTVPWALSERRGDISWRKVIQLVLFQIALMLLFLKLPQAQQGFLFLGRGVQAFQQAVMAGTSFVFGYVGGGTPPFALTNPQGSSFIFIFQALPIIVVTSALSMLLFHWGVLPWVVRKTSVIARSIGCIGGALGTALGAKIFLGQMDTPLLVKPYLQRFSRHELFTVMTVGMATTSLALFSLYASFLEPVIGNAQALRHIVTSGIINIFSSLIVAELMIPGGQEKTQGEAQNPHIFTNAVQAIAQGTADGWTIMWSVGAMIMVSLALVTLVNTMIGSLSQWMLGCPIQIETLLGYVFAPFVWCMGIPSAEVLTVGKVLATKTVLNEVVAFMDLSRHPFAALSPRTIGILVYSLCSFGSLSSLAIQIAGFSVLAPTRKEEVAALASRSLIAGLLAGGLSSALVSFVL